MFWLPCCTWRKKKEKKFGCRDCWAFSSRRFLKKKLKKINFLTQADGDTIWQQQSGKYPLWQDITVTSVWFNNNNKSFFNSALDESDFNPQRLFLKRRRSGVEDFIFWCIECRRKLHHPWHPFCPRGLTVILPKKTHRSIRPLFSPVATCTSLRLKSDGKVPLWHCLGFLVFFSPNMSSRSCFSRGQDVCWVGFVTNDVQLWKDKKSQAAMRHWGLKIHQLKR